MWAKYLYVEFIVIYFLSLVPCPPPNVLKLLCSKDNARLVRKLVQAKWMPILDKYHVKLPLECPLHPLRDIFGPQQEAKKQNRPTQWTCQLCGKSFFEEKYIDLHFESRHKDHINKAEDAICLADFCDIMRCEVFLIQENTLSNGETTTVTDIQVWDESSSRSSSLAKATTAYVALMPHSISNRNNYLMPRALTTTDSVHKVLPNYQHFCKDTSTTEKPTKDNSNQRKQSIKSGGESSDDNGNNGKLEISNKSNNTDANNKTNSTTCEESTPHTTMDENKTYGDHFINIQKKRASCKPEDLAKLKIKCEMLVRSCVAGLLLEMSDYAFKEMEGELNKAICWYLTCERYWDVIGPLEPRAFPWGLILVLVMVLSLGICFCYYIIWILFDSEEIVPSVHHQSTTIGDRRSPYNMARHYTDRQKDDGTRMSSMGLQINDQDIIRERKYTEDVVLTAADSNDLTNSEHYIYVTYPADLKRRLLEKYE